jgi:hypothetical protein
MNRNKHLPKYEIDNLFKELESFTGLLDIGGNGEE